MRELRFIVEGQQLKKDPTCNFDNINVGTEKYLCGRFIFSDEWKGFAKAIAFWSVLGEEYNPIILTNGKTCIFPSEVLTKRRFGIQVVGKKDDQILKTNKEFVLQGGDKL